MWLSVQGKAAASCSLYRSLLHAPHDRPPEVLRRFRPASDLPPGAPEWMDSQGNSQARLDSSVLHLFFCAHISSGMIHDRISAGSVRHGNTCDLPFRHAKPHPPGRGISDYVDDGYKRAAKIMASLRPTCRPQCCVHGVVSVIRYARGACHRFRRSRLYRHYSRVLTEKLVQGGQAA